MSKELKLGITGSSVIHASTGKQGPVEEQFRMVKESDVYDYFDKTPPVEEADEYRRCSEKFDLPIRAGGWFYALGRDEQFLEDNLKLGASLGSLVHNTQIGTYHADGHMVSDDEVAESYLRAYEVGESVGCMPTYELHVNMWSEDFRRICIVADKVEARGIPFRMTLDHSHVIFKIDNPEEQEVQNIRPAVESGELILDPYQDGNISDIWIQRGFVWHGHARAAVPAGPKNIWHTNEDGSHGRGIQYPFIEPEPGQWHSAWDAAKLEPWKEVIRHLLAYHATHDDSPLLQISTEFIPFSDYGAGSTYSIFDHSVACAQWIRDEWDSLA